MEVDICRKKKGKSNIGRSGVYIPSRPVLSPEGNLTAHLKLGGVDAGEAGPLGHESRIYLCSQR